MDKNDDRQKWNSRWFRTSAMLCMVTWSTVLFVSMKFNVKKICTA